MASVLAKKEYGFLHQTIRAEFYGHPDLLILHTWAARLFRWRSRSSFCQCQSGCLHVLFLFYAKSTEFEDKVKNNFLDLWTQGTMKTAPFHENLKKTHKLFCLAMIFMGKTQYLFMV